MTDQAREPGIRLVGIVVERIRFDDIPAGGTRPKNLSYVARIERRRGTDGEFAEAVVHMVVKPAPPEDSLFLLEVSVAGRFELDKSAPNMPLDEFMRLNGPTIVIPFVREMVTNITARSRNGIVFLPAINVVELVRREEAAAGG